MCDGWPSPAAASSRANFLIAVGIERETACRDLLAQRTGRKLTTIGTMLKKLIILAVLVALGAVAAKRLRGS